MIHIILVIVTALIVDLFYESHESFEKLAPFQSHMGKPTLYVTLDHKASHKGHFLKLRFIQHLKAE